MAGLIAGCGAGPLRGGETGSNEATTTATTSTETGAGSSTETGAGSSTETGDDPEPEPEPEPDPPTACAEGGILARPLAVVGADEIRVIEAHGLHEVLELPVPVPGGVAISQRVGSSPSYIVVASRYAVHSTVLRLFERYTGELVWEFDLDYGLGLKGLWVDDEGKVVAPGAQAGGQALPVGVLVIDGELRELSNFEPAGPAREDGWIPGHVGDTPETTAGAGFLLPATEQYVASTEGAIVESLHVLDGTIQYLDTSDSPLHVVIADPEGETRLELPDVGDLVQLDAAGDYRLFSTPPEPGQLGLLVRLDVETGESEVFDLALPDGLEAFTNCGAGQPVVDASGRIILPAADTGAVHVQAWDPDTNAWTEIGMPVTQIATMQIMSGPGQVKRARAGGASFGCDLPVWSEPPVGALEGASLQLVRVEPALSHHVELAPSDLAEPGELVSIDPYELCAAWAASGQLLIQDLDDAMKYGPGSGDYVAWLE